MKAENVKELVKKDSFLQLLEQMYGKEKAETNAARYEMVAEGFSKAFGEKEFEFFTSPGRTEIGGNHTDHNQGKVLAGSIQMDCVAAAAANGTETIHLISETYRQDLVVDLHALEPSSETTGTLPLVKGVLAGLKKRGFEIHGFDAYITSNVIGGAGVSSSASFEMLVCSIVDYLFNHNTRDIVSYAKAGQYAEHKYWLKGSGLLDQMACAVGGIITIDFADNEEPNLRVVDCNFDDLNLDLVIVNTGKGHADLSAEYTSIPNEMKRVAAFFGKEVLAETTEEDVVAKAEIIRSKCGDRALLRSLHFFEENKRVDREVAALESGDKDGFLEEITASGNSSWKWLQNCYVNETPEEQSITCALALTELFLKQINGGACRVHGGGFAGVIAAFIPKEHTEEYCRYMDHALGKGSAFVMHIRKQGAIHLDF